MSANHEDRVQRRAERLKAQKAGPKPRGEMLEAIERRVAELVDQAPPLTPEQKDQLSQLFRKARP